VSRRTAVRFSEEQKNKEKPRLAPTRSIRRRANDNSASSKQQCAGGVQGVISPLAHLARDLLMLARHMKLAQRQRQLPPLLVLCQRRKVDSRKVQAAQARRPLHPLQRLSSIERGTC
jgi:hypothetical protein